MHIDLAHALVSAGLILLTLWALRHFGVVEPGKRRFDWRVFAAIFGVLFVFNLIWPV